MIRVHSDSDMYSLEDESRNKSSCTAYLSKGKNFDQY